MSELNKLKKVTKYRGEVVRRINGFNQRLHIPCNADGWVDVEKIVSFGDDAYIAVDCSELIMNLGGRVKVLTGGLGESREVEVLATVDGYVLIKEVLDRYVEGIGKLEWPERMKIRVVTKIEESRVIREGSYDEIRGIRH